MHQTFKSIYVIVFLIMACFGLGYFVAYPQYTKYSAAKAQLAILQADNEKLNQDLAAIQSFSDSFKSHQQESATASLALPAKSSDLGNLLASLGDLAKSSGVALSNVNITDTANTASSAVSDNSIQVVPIALSASGSYPAFKDFMIRLQTHLRLVDVGHVSLKGDEAGQVQYQVNIKTYYQK